MSMTSLKLKQWIVTSILLTAISPFSAHAGRAQGGTSGGGGTLIYPTKAEVVEALQNALGDVEEGIGNLHAKQNEISDPVLKKVMKSFFTQTRNAINYNPIDRVIQNASAEIVDGPCYHKGEIKAAAVNDFYLGKNFPRDKETLESDENFYAKICYSISEFKKVPRANLKQNIIALSIHELSHLFGYDEVVAKKLQSYLLEEGKGLLTDVMQAVDLSHEHVLGVEFAVMKLRKDLAERKSDKVICAHLGELVTLNDAFGRFLVEANDDEDSGRELKITDDMMVAGDKLALDIYPMYGYCGVRDLENVGFTKYVLFDSIADKYIQEGNRSDLAKRLKTTLAKIIKVEKLLKVNQQYRKELLEYISAQN